MGVAAPRAKTGAPRVLLGKRADWGRANSRWPLTFGLACGAIAMMATSASCYDLAREPTRLVLYPGCRHGLDQGREALDRDRLAWIGDAVGAAR